MRVRCHLRDIRERMPRKENGKRVTTTDISKTAGVGGGIISQIERGMTFPTDRQIEPLEQAYGAPITDWYAPRVLLVLEEDETDG